MKHLCKLWLGGCPLLALLGACSAEADPMQASAREGRLLLEQYDCGSCHVIPGVRRAQGQVGPSLAAFSRRAYLAGEIPNGPETLQQWIQRPSAWVPDTRMPDQNVSAHHARAMSAYLMSLH
jgi:cytochrome c2